MNVAEVLDVHDLKKIRAAKVLTSTKAGGNKTIVRNDYIACSFEHYA